MKLRDLTFIAIMESEGERCGYRTSEPPGAFRRAIWTIINNAWGVAAPDAFLEHELLKGVCRPET
jgi:hypothetical protein